MLPSYREYDPILCPCGQPALQYGKRCIEHIITSMDGYDLDLELADVNLPTCLYRPCEEPIKIGFDQYDSGVISEFCFMHKVTSCYKGDTIDKLEYIVEVDRYISERRYDV